MLGFYGRRFLDMWAGIDEAMIKEVWRRKLASYGGQEIANGLNAMESRKMPPTLPEFMELCRPPLEPEAAYHEAIVQMRRRHIDGTDQWSNPAIYWAAAEVGNDLFALPWKLIEARWRYALREAQKCPRQPPERCSVERLEHRQPTEDEKVAAFERFKELRRTIGI